MTQIIHYFFIISVILFLIVGIVGLAQILMGRHLWEDSDEMK